MEEFKEMMKFEKLFRGLQVIIFFFLSFAILMAQTLEEDIAVHFKILAGLLFVFLIILLFTKGYFVQAFEGTSH